MNVILFDDQPIRENLLPLTFTRPVADIRIGILTIREKWERLTGLVTSSKTQSYLSTKYTTEYTIDTDNVWINGSVLPSKVLLDEVKALEPQHVLLQGDTIIAINSGNDQEFPGYATAYKKVNSKADLLQIKFPWDIFSKNDVALRADFDLLTTGRKSLPIDASNQVKGKNNIFLEEGASVTCSILNAETGPIYIGKDAEVMEGSIIRGPFSLGEHAALKLGTKIYGATTIGPHSKVGGEVNNSVIFGYSNKAHDGFLGNAVVAEWCNLGADSNNSNLKNNYGEVRIWSYAEKDYIPTGLTFCGLIMGDHSKCGINTMFNTGTVVGINANIFGAGFPATHIPSFSWGGASDSTVYKLPTAFEVAARVFQRRGLVFDEQEQKILTHIFEITRS
ncbi:MAG TPA: GlmU family protein [Bacteroidia bacterium]|jgi:UDP-N-acetylglucosamine diphosphorylase/glucosamine-1-phosphate N-acetyltransferase|nr:GlmU family protein [Bacteroidia bacterium]